RHKSEQQGAMLLFEQSHARCDHLNAAEGLLWLGESLQAAIRTGSSDLERSVRTHIDAWHRDLHLLRGVMSHEASVEAAAYSPDGLTIVTGSRDGTAQLWNIETDEPLCPPCRHEGPVVAVAFSPDGR